MATFRSINELANCLNREKKLLQEMFKKRKDFAFRYDYARELADYADGRIRFLIDYGVIRESGDFLEMEDVYLKFFEDVLQVNEDINTSTANGYITHLNETIDYYLKENNEKRRYGYLHEVRRTLKNIALVSVRNVIDLKRNMDNTYKNEPNYKIKKIKLQRLDSKREDVSVLIRRCEELIDNGQPLFFSSTLDATMRECVADVRTMFNDSYHNLIEIHKQLVHYINMIEYQNRIFEKARKLQYLKSQFLLEQNSDIRNVLARRNDVCMEPQVRAHIKLSVNWLRTSDDAMQSIVKVAGRMKNNRRKDNLAGPLSADELSEQTKTIDTVNLTEMFNTFAASSMQLFKFVMDYDYKIPATRADKLVYFCQLASQFSDRLNFTDRYERSDNVEYPVITMKRQ